MQDEEDKSRSKRLNFSVFPSQYRGLKEKADSKKRSIGDELREMLRRYLRKK